MGMISFVGQRLRSSCPKRRKESVASTFCHAMLTVHGDVESESNRFEIVLDIRRGFLVVPSFAGYSIVAGLRA